MTQALRYSDGALWLLDQTLLPDEERWLELRDATGVIDAIRRLAVRGAPLIGVAAGYGLALECARVGSAGEVEAAAARLRTARPTAVNLAYGVDRVLGAAMRASPGQLAAASLAEAEALHADELAASAGMAAAGADWLLDAVPGSGGLRVLTHCNTGFLAAPGAGTALGVVAELWRRGELSGVIATESRPLLQGARLTVWELARLGIPCELIVDSAAAGLICGGAVDAVVVGCDRVAANGDVANKVGTLGLALAASSAGVPFVVVGPSSTVDESCESGASIVVEERSEDEVRSVRGQRLTVPGTRCRNPAFDVTPASLVSALVTEAGVKAFVGDARGAR